MLKLWCLLEPTFTIVPAFDRKTLPFEVVDILVPIGAVFLGV
jgi:hypothetical protein